MDLLVNDLMEFLQLTTTENALVFCGLICTFVALIYLFKKLI